METQTQTNESDKVKRSYEEIVTNLTEVMNHKGREKKGFNSYEEIIKLLRELKQNCGIELSTYFLKNLLNSTFSKTQKSDKIRNLIKNLKDSVTLRQSEYYYKCPQLVKYNTDVKTFGYKKGFENKVILKDIRNQKVGRFFIQHRKRLLTFFVID